MRAEIARLPEGIIIWVVKDFGPGGGFPFEIDGVVRIRGFIGVFGAFVFEYGAKLSPRTARAIFTANILIDKDELLVGVVIHRAAGGRNKVFSIRFDGIWRAGEEQRVSFGDV